MIIIHYIQMIIYIIFNWEEINIVTTGIYLSLKIALYVQVFTMQFTSPMQFVEHNMEFNFIVLIEKGQNWLKWYMHAAVFSKSYYTLKVQKV